MPSGKRSSIDISREAVKRFLELAAAAGVAASVSTEGDNVVAVADGVATVLVKGRTLPPSSSGVLFGDGGHKRDRSHMRDFIVVIDVEGTERLVMDSDAVADAISGGGAAYADNLRPAAVRALAEDLDRWLARIARGDGTAVERGRFVASIVATTSRLKTPRPVQKCPTHPDLPLPASGVCDYCEQ